MNVMRCVMVGMRNIVVIVYVRVMSGMVYVSFYEVIGYGDFIGLLVGVNC